MGSYKFFSAWSVVLVSVALSGCSAQPDRQYSRGTTSNAQPTVNEITAEASRLDKTLEDGWIVGRDPRTFKSPYGRTSARSKAQFAIEYAQFVKRSGQDLARDWKSYLPYSRRANFALQWWQRDPSFVNLDERKQNIWIHETLLDASELYWRLYERANNPDNAAVIAHDVEQNMVCKFMENDHTEGTWGDFRKSTASSNNFSQQ